MSTVTTKQVRDALALIADTVGKTKAGNFVVRRGFYYRNGCDSEKFRTAVAGALAKNSITVTVVDSGEVWKPFRGGATTAQGSHWFVEFKPQ